MTYLGMPGRPGEPGKRRIGVYICHCGGNISDYVDVEEVARAVADGDEEVVVSVSPVFACSDGTQHDMIDDIRGQELDGLVVASCSPKLHLATFRGVSKRADLNPYAYTQVNIREQDSWVHSHDRAGATQKAIGLVKAGIARTKLSSPLDPLIVETLPHTLVIGGGVTGLRTAVGLADIGLAVTLVERADRLGGHLAARASTYPKNASGGEQIAQLVAKVEARPGITVLTGAEVTGKSGSFGNYTVTIERRTGHGEPGHGAASEPLTIEVGAIVVATGFDDYVPEPGEFGTGEPGVVTLPDFIAAVDAATAAGAHELVVEGRRVRSLAYIYCVGSRQEAPGNEYCSKFCCASTLHTSTRVNAIDPALRQYHLHRDVRAYGRQEQLYEDARTAGAVFLKVPDDTPPVVEPLAPAARVGRGRGQEQARLGVTAVDVTTDGEEVTLPVDLVVLVTGAVPRANEALTSLLKLPVGEDGFYNEIHPKLRPVETVVDGVLIAGCCQGPKTVAESVASGLSAVAQSAALLRKGYTEIDPQVAEVTTAACTGCGDCLTTCPYDAISAVSCDGGQVATILAASCKGCGGCVPICPESAIDLLGYTDAQMRAAIAALVEDPDVPTGIPAEVLA